MRAAKGKTRIVFSMECMRKLARSWMLSHRNLSMNSSDTFGIRQDHDHQLPSYQGSDHRRVLANSTFRPISIQDPTRLPTGEELYKQAKKMEANTAAGSDGWRPAELKRLPLSAWHKRHSVLQLCAKLGGCPDAYYIVSTTLLQKKESSLDLLDFMLLSVFSAQYRVEAGA